MVVAGSSARTAGGRTGRAVEAAAGAVETVVGGAAQAASDVVETLGTAARNGLDAASAAAARAPVAGPALGFGLHWLATVVSAAFGLAATVVQAPLDLAAGLVAGTIRLAGGAPAASSRGSRDTRMARRGLGDIASSVAGSVVLLAGKALALLQAVAFMQLGERALTAGERDLLRQVFRGSVALYNVRLATGFAGLFSVNKRPFTLGNTIYLKAHDPADDDGTLVHECAHVWQFQNAGVRYASDALWAQARLPGGKAYEWAAEEGRGRPRWLDFNREAQAALVQEVWRRGVLAGAAGAGGVFYIDDPVGPGACFTARDGKDRTPIATECVTALRAVIPWRLSARL